MATWTTDILGTGLAHHAPTKQERTLARRIARRWQAWHPLLLHELRQRPHPPGHVARELLRLERAHARAMAELFADRHTPAAQWNRMAYVQRSRLDDPRMTDDERAYRLAHRGHPPKAVKVKRPKGRPLGWRKPIPPPPHPPEVSCERFVRLRLRSEEPDASSA